MIAGRYTLEREIGRGGMGDVWLAHDEVLGRKVAMKRIGMFPGASSPDLARAEREAKLAAKLNHPHVVAVYDFVTGDDRGEQWLVMEYVSGVTLAALARSRGGLPADEAAGIVRQAAEALAAAHEVGVVHRDVTPSNIIVTSDGTAKLMDFGIARAQADATLTQTGLVTGSPAYLAPEVATGRAATAASDVWSLGATLFYALTGRPPYEVEGNVVAALYKIVHEQPPRLADAGWLAPVLEATMTPEPELRWSMAQVRDHLSGVPVTPMIRPAAPAPAHQTANTQVVVPRRSTRPPRAVPLLALAAAAMLVLLVGALAWGVLRPDGSSDTPRTGAGQTTRSPSSPSTEVDAAAMRGFIESYVQQAVGDPERAFASLTPSFQQQSKGIEGYRGFWDTIKRAEVSHVAADPEAMTVSYDVRYRRQHGSPVQDHVELRLVRQDGQYLIDGES